MECLSCVHRVSDDPAIKQWNRLWDTHINSQTGRAMTNNNAVNSTSDFLPFDDSSRGEGKIVGRDNVEMVSRYAHCHPNDGFIMNPGKVPEPDPRFTPWKSRDKRYSPGVIGLHEEIVDFYDYVTSTPAEEKMRTEVIQKVSDLIVELWPTSKVEVFGSTKTKLNLPSSDIDMVAFGHWATPPLRTLESELLKKEICRAEELKVLDKASVPIIKFTDEKTKLKVDICFNMANGLQCVELIERYLLEYPNLRYLVMVLKQFLFQRDLNEVFNGGLSSYALILLVVSFFQNHEREDANRDDANVGVLLIEFLELYGRRFNYINTAITVTNGGRYLKKQDMKMDDGSLPSGLCIDDPLKPGNDIGRSSYQILTIREAFSRAYMLLVSFVLPQNITLFDRRESILGTVIEISLNVQKYRKRVLDMYAEVELEQPVTTVSVASLVHPSSLQNSHRPGGTSQKKEGNIHSDESSDMSSRNQSESESESLNEASVGVQTTAPEVRTDRIAVSVQTNSTKRLSSSDDQSSGSDEQCTSHRPKGRGVNFYGHPGGRSTSSSQSVRHQGTRTNPRGAAGASVLPMNKRRKQHPPPHNRH